MVVVSALVLVSALTLVLALVHPRQLKWVIARSSGDVMGSNGDALSPGSRDFRGFTKVNFTEA